MRLLATNGTFRLEEFAAQPFPSYAILSHTWGNPEDEVIFQDLSNSLARAKQKAGFSKIEGACERAQKDLFEWIWIDTCCIDKTNLTELSEAINSMYAWYEEARVCYVHLADVRSSGLLTAVTDGRLLDPSGSIRKSRWFTRGWTLQELIAPDIVEFYTREWLEIGTKSSMVDAIADITGISTGVLRGERASNFSVAERMGWAAMRQTTRVEDKAYCLLGIFGVNMPLIYGEGGRAFLRLQEAILGTTEDYTILAYSLDGSRIALIDGSPDESLNSAISATLKSESEHPIRDPPLTSYPDCFLSSGKIYARIRSSTPSQELAALGSSVAASATHVPPSMTSRGLHIYIFLLQLEPGSRMHFAYFHCRIGDTLVCMILREIDHNGQTFVRVSRSVFEQYLLLPSECLARFTLRGIYLSTSLETAPHPFTQMRNISRHFKLQVDVSDGLIRCHEGWVSWTNNTKPLNNNSTFHVDEYPGAIRCAYTAPDRQFRFVVVLRLRGIDIHAGEPCRYQVTDGPMAGANGSPCDRVTKRIDNSLVYAAYKAVRDYTVVKVMVRRQPWSPENWRRPKT